ncbi:MAG TPA: hypothetical protein VM286_04720 [Candidatus Thermoplasmatota archaeon]|nr:hypothetical protein [Candidatus Thermoplasmatota archaeon]
MTSAALPRILPVLALCAVLSLPGAAAESALSGSVVARTLAFEQPAQQSGQASFLHILQEDNGEPHAITMSFAGTHVEGTQYTAEGYREESQVPFSTLHALDALQPPAQTPFSADHAVAALSGADAGYTLNIFSPQPLSFEASLREGTQAVLAHPELNHGSIQERPDPSTVPQASSQDPEPYWTVTHSETAHVVTEALSATLHLAGTFTIEVIGLDFDLRGDGGSTQLHSGVQRDRLVPGVDAYKVRQDFLRIEVTDGSLDLGVRLAPAMTASVNGQSVPDATLAQWSGPGADSASGSISLDGATGSFLRADGQQQRLTGSSYRFEGRYELHANPSEQGLQLGITGLDDQGQPLSPATQTVRPVASTLAWLIALAAAAVAAGATVAIVLLRRHPTMADLESGLETGHFRRVVRDSARILRKRPGFEDAVISRSIALSKLGRNGRVVREVRTHFASREPSDGVLHYVLGLALKELGETAQAQEAWKEAVRRTPGLLPQVAPFFPAQQASSTPSAVTGVVDGTAYA